MSEEDTRRFLDKYRESNAKIAREFLGYEGDLFTEAPEGNTLKWEFDNRKMFEAALLLLGKTAYSQSEKTAQQIRDLSTKQKALEKALAEQKQKTQEEKGKREALARRLDKQVERTDRLRHQMDILLLPALPVRKLAAFLKKKKKH